MDELLKRINEEDDKTALFIMDIAKFPISKKVIDYLTDIKIIIIKILRYLSNFNSIELIFISYKNIIYKENYKGMKSLKKECLN